LGVELPCEITTPLADVETHEKETISLVLVISKRRKVTWLKNGKEVVASDRFQISVSEDGLRHVLTLKGVTKEEMAEFTASIDDASYGVIASSCKVTVVGMSVIVRFSHVEVVSIITNVIIIIIIIITTITTWSSSEMTYNVSMGTLNPTILYYYYIYAGQACRFIT